MAKSILIVDDNSQNRTLLADVLTRHGFTVLLAKDGEEGVNLARAHTPDLILMDIQMPVMNGLEAGKALRADPRTREIRILVLSSYTTLEDPDNFLATGFDGTIDKPINIRELPAIVKMHLELGPCASTSSVQK